MKSGGLHGWQHLWIKHLKFCAGDTQVQITSLTDFPSKLAHVHVIKVSFLLENRDRGLGSRWKERRGGGGKGAIKPFTKIILPRNRVSRLGGGASAEPSLADPRSGSCVESMPTTTRDPRPPALPTGCGLSPAEGPTLLLTSADVGSQTDQWN